MNKAFIFDMDGVLVDSEHEWHIHDTRILDDLFTGEARLKMGNSIGLNIRGIHEKAIRIGHPIDFETLKAEYNRVAPEIYDAAAITPGVSMLIEKLSSRGFKLGVVTASSHRDIDKVLPRIVGHEKFEVVISLEERHDLNPKPAPDGYIEILREFRSDPAQSFVLEDSNYGIEAAKKAGCFVIGYRGNLLEGYEQTGADEYADTMEEVANIVEIRSKTR